jgi:hypothetical protein
MTYPHCSPSTRNPKLAVLLTFLMILASAAVLAAKSNYQTGQLISIDTDYDRMRLPSTSGHDELVQVRKTYRFAIQSGDVTYLAECEERKYKSEWQMRSPVEFRIDKQRFFLKRANGKELELRLLDTIPSRGLPR